MTPLRVGSTRDLGPQFVDNPHGMIGQDGAFSIPMRKETLWYFGDTLFGERVPGESLWYPGGVAVGHADMTGKGSILRMLNNTGLILSDADGRNGLREFRYICDAGGKPRTLLPLAPDEDPDWTRIWCLHGIALGGKLILWFVKVRMLAEGPFPVNFEIVGSGMALGESTSFQFQRVVRNGSSILWKGDEPHFAAAAIHDEATGFVYLYGALQDAGGSQCAYLARVQGSAIGDPGAYEYLNSLAPAWGKNPLAGVPVFEGMPNELSVSYNAHLRSYLAVHSYLLSGDIVARAAPAPWGPWSDPVVLWHVDPARPRPLPYPPLVYAGKEHPELSRDGGRVVYLTYIEFEEYYPHLVEVTLA